jgi:hypothetical protein
LAAESANATPCRTPVPPVLSGRDQVFLAPSVDDFAAYRVYGSRKNTPKLWPSYGATSRSLLRHAGFAQAREIGRFEPGVDRRRHDGAGNAENREVERWPSVELVDHEGFAARIILVGSSRNSQCGTAPNDARGRDPNRREFPRFRPPYRSCAILGITRATVLFVPSEGPTPRLGAAKLRRLRQSRDVARWC